MKKDELLPEIIKKCLDLDIKANYLYKTFSRADYMYGLKVFWKEMAEQEQEHVKFWEEMLDFAETMHLPMVFDKPFNIIKELDDIQQKSETLQEIAGETREISMAFVLAFKMEFALLHPAFNMLFQIYKNITGNPTPGDNYREHLQQFIDKLYDIGAMSPELEVLGEVIKRLWEENQQLYLYSDFDPLTEVYNRRGLLKVIEPLSNIARRNKYAIGMMMIDIDDFKKFNDTFGHLTGDDILKKVAGLIKNYIRKSDIVGRFGGEEFLVFLSQVKPDLIYRLANNLRKHISKEMKDKYNLTVSIGVSTGEIGENWLSDLEKMIKQADTAMYNAKKTGKNRVFRFNKEKERSE